MQNVSLPVFGRGFETYHHRQLRNSLFGTNPRLTARLLSRTGNFFAFDCDSLRWIRSRDIKYPNCPHMTKNSTGNLSAFIFNWPQNCTVRGFLI